MKGIVFKKLLQSILCIYFIRSSKNYKKNLIKRQSVLKRLIILYSDFQKQVHHLMTFLCKEDRARLISLFWILKEKTNVNQAWRDLLNYIFCITVRLTNDKKIIFVVKYVLFRKIKN